MGAIVLRSIYPTPYYLSPMLPHASYAAHASHAAHVLIMQPLLRMLPFVSACTEQASHLLAAQRRC